MNCGIFLGDPCDISLFSTFVLSSMFWGSDVITTRHRTFGKALFPQMPVCHSVQRAGGFHVTINPWCIGSHCRGPPPDMTHRDTPWPPLERLFPSWLETHSILVQLRTPPSPHWYWHQVLLKIEIHYILFNAIHVYRLLWYQVIVCEENQ